jgi:hypothetical protein
MKPPKASPEVRAFLGQIGRVGGSSTSPAKVAAVTQNIKVAQAFQRAAFQARQGRRNAVAIALARPKPKVK